MFSVWNQTQEAFNQIAARHALTRLDKVTPKSVHAFYQQIQGVSLQEEDRELLKRLQGVVQEASKQEMKAPEANLRTLIEQLVQQTLMPRSAPALVAAPVSTMNEVMSYEDLPDEMFGEVLIKLSPKEAARLAQTDPRHRAAFYEFCEQQLKPVLVEGLEDHAWSEELTSSKNPSKSAEILQRMVDYLLKYCSDDKRSTLEKELHGEIFGLNITKVLENFHEHNARADQLLVDFYHAISSLMIRGFCPAIPPELSTTKEIAQWIRQLPVDHDMFKINYLHLENSRLTGLPPEIKRFTRLLSLFLAGSEAAYLPPEFYDLKLNVISWGSIDYEQIPESTRDKVRAFTQTTSAGPR